MEHLDVYIERFEGKVVYYNNDKQFGSIYQEDDDNLSLDNQIIFMMKLLKKEMLLNIVL